MGRWAPDARERLESAALDLFVENGYEQTTVAQIADRAGMNRATFFRHFADKREVIMAGEDVLADLFTDAIRAAAAGATATQCLQVALAAASHVMTPQRRSAAIRRIQAVGANSAVPLNGPEASYFISGNNSQRQLPKLFTQVYIEGRGSGHGLGMSQWGARGMALEGYNYLQIIEHYYNQDKKDGRLTVKTP